MRSWTLKKLNASTSTTITATYSLPRVTLSELGASCWLLWIEHLVSGYVRTASHNILWCYSYRPFVGIEICYTARDRELRKEGDELPAHVRSREGPIGVPITLGQPTITFFQWVGGLLAGLLVYPPVP